MKTIWCILRGCGVRKAGAGPRVRAKSAWGLRSSPMPEHIIERTGLYRSTYMNSPRVGLYIYEYRPFRGLQTWRSEPCKTENSRAENFSDRFGSSLGTPMCMGSMHTRGVPDCWGRLQPAGGTNSRGGNLGVRP